jgi:hypothetical protein
MIPLLDVMTDEAWRVGATRQGPTLSKVGMTRLLDVMTDGTWRVAPTWYSISPPLVVE